MKGMNLVLVMTVLLLGFACAEVNDTNTSLENDTVLVNETDLVDDIVVVNETVEELEVDDIVIEGEGVVEDEDSAFDVVVSYVSGVIDKINAVHENLFLVLLIVLWVLLLFLHSIFYGEKPAGAYFAKASSFHRRAQRAHVSGDYVKAKKLYSKSYSLREEGERKADLEI